MAGGVMSPDLHQHLRCYNWMSGALEWLFYLQEYHVFLLFLLNDYQIIWWDRGCTVTFKTPKITYLNTVMQILREGLRLELVVCFSTESPECPDYTKKFAPIPDVKSPQNQIQGYQPRYLIFFVCFLHFFSAVKDQEEVWRDESTPFFL